MSIPLVQNNEKDSINTSIIAIKRQIERINALLGLSNSEEIDTSVFATKTELEDAVTQVETDLAPVDEVTIGNMQSVTSNAVAKVLPKMLKTTKTVPYYSDYSYRITPSDLGLTTFANAVVQISATAWENMVDIQEQANDHITMRVWQITTTRNAIVSLKSSGSVIMLFTVIYYE